jgi:ribosomal protein L30E
MKILFTPLITRLKIDESHERIKALSEECMKRGHSVALCINENCNYSKIKGTSTYKSPLPKNWKSSRMKKKTGKDSKSKDWFYFVESMHSFSDALKIMGAVSTKHYKKDVESIIKAIDMFNPDIVYSDLRPAAVSASLIRGIPIASTITYPLCEYLSKDQYAIEIINIFNKKNNIPKYNSICDFIDKSDLKFVPSIYELEPLAGKSIIFSGPFVKPKPVKKLKPSKKIIIKIRSMNQDILLKETIQTFKNSNYKVILVSSKLEESDYGNISVRKSINMKKQLADTTVFINNGENKDIVNAIMTDTPQIVVKCNVYFLKYNGYSIQINNAGLFIDKSDFNKNKLPGLVDKIMSKEKYMKNTKRLSKILSQHRGVLQVIDEIEGLVGK